MIVHKTRFLIVALLVYASTTLRAQDQDAFWTRWNHAQEAEDWKTAELAMREGLAAFPGQANMAASLAWALRCQGRIEEALALIEPLFVAKPADKTLREALVYALLDWGWAFYAKRDYPAALAPFTRAYALLPDNPSAMNAYGCALRDTGRVEEAIPIMERGYAAFPDDPYLRPNLGYAYVIMANRLAEAGDPGTAAMFAKAGALDPLSEAYLLNYGNYLMGLKRHDEALALFESCLARYPANRWVSGNIQYALQERERAIAETGDYRAAFRETEAAAARYPREVWFLLDLFDYSMRLGDLGAADRRLRAILAEPALQDYGKVLSLSPEDLLIFRLRDIVWKYETAKDYGKAFSLIAAYTVRFPGSLGAEETRGNLLFHSGKKDEGLALVNRVYERYIKDHPEFAAPLILPLPFKGTFLVWGNNRSDSITHAGMNRFCFDFMGADDTGRTLRPGVTAPGRNEDYYGFGADVLSVCDGVVESVEEGCTDIEPRLTPILGDGNAIVIRDAKGFHYNYVHIKRGSATVRPGQTVKAGQKLAELGNSGYTASPHLHFGVYSPDWRVSIPVRFLAYSVKTATGAWQVVKEGVPDSDVVVRD